MTFRHGGKMQLCLDLFSATMNTKKKKKRKKISEVFRGKGFSIRTQYPAKLLLRLQETKDILMCTKTQKIYHSDTFRIIKK